MASKYDLVNYKMISCRQLSGADFVLQIAGNASLQVLGFQNFSGGIPPNLPSLARPFGPCIFSGRLSYPDARLLKHLLKPLCRLYRRRLVYRVVFRFYTFLVLHGHVLH